MIANSETNLLPMGRSGFDSDDAEIDVDENRCAETEGNEAGYAMALG